MTGERWSIDLNFRSRAAIRNDEAHTLRMPVYRCWDLLSIDTDFVVFGRESIDFDMQFLPPCRIGSLVRTRFEAVFVKNGLRIALVLGLT
jgi:hypothetical protein